MRPLTSLLVPLDGSQAAARGLGCAMWLVERLGAKLHLLSATAQALPAREELARLHVPEAYWPRVILHQAPQFPEDAILAAATEHEVALIIMSALGHASEQSIPSAPGPLAAVGHVSRAVIERSSVPVLLLPPSYREALPWNTVLVPISGEAEVDEALTEAVSFANALSLEVHVVHVVDGPGDEPGLAASARYADAVHHEYPQQLTELARKALAHRSAEDCHCIAHVALARGQVETELLKQIEQQHISLLVIGWHGRFMSGHAEVLKALLAAITCPLLLVKPARHGPFKLKVGADIG